MGSSDRHFSDPTTEERDLRGVAQEEEEEEGGGRGRWGVTLSNAIHKKLLRTLA